MGKIALQNAIEWPPRPPDLSPCEVFGRFFTTTDYHGFVSKNFVGDSSLEEI